MSSLSPRGMIFDLDGTLVDSGLDFDQMRREMDLPYGLPILEALATLPAAEARRCEAILLRHEAEGARRATLMPGAREFLRRLDEFGIRRAIVTRNGRTLTMAVLERLTLRFDPVITRDDAPPKPDPASIWRICESWGLLPSEVLVLGDFRFDIEAGRAAGASTLLFTAGRNPQGLPGVELADHVVGSFAEAERLLFG